MYRKIVVATDGSEIAGKAVDQAIALAKELGAKLTAVTVTEPYEAIAFAETIGLIDPSEYKKQCDEHANNVLSEVVAKAKISSIVPETIHQDEHWHYAGVIAAAENSGADLIIVGSHGRRGVEALLLGSQAVKLLTHTKIPTLVVR
jgi:nucleotide-binding universal stress UspA family protein